MTGTGRWVRAAQARHWAALACTRQHRSGAETGDITGGHRGLSVNRNPAEIKIKNAHFQAQCKLLEIMIQLYKTTAFIKLNLKP